MFKNCWKFYLLFLISSLSLVPFHTSHSLLNTLTIKENIHDMLKLQSVFQRNLGMVVVLFYLRVIPQCFVAANIKKYLHVLQNERNVNKIWWKILEHFNVSFIVSAIWQVYNNSISLNQQRSIIMLFSLPLWYLLTWSFAYWFSYDFCTCCTQIKSFVQYLWFYFLITNCFYNCMEF